MEVIAGNTVYRADGLELWTYDFGSDGSGQNCSGSCREVGVDKNHGDIFVGSSRGSRVETEPAQPENKDSQRNEGYVVAKDRFDLAVFCIFTHAGTEYDGTGQSSPSAN